MKKKKLRFTRQFDQLIEKCPLPAILHWEQNHFVVLYGISRSFLDKRRVFSVANPAFGRQRLGEEEFCRHWLAGERGVAIACEPSCKARQGSTPMSSKAVQASQSSCSPSGE